MTIELGTLCNGTNDSHVANCHWFYLQTLVDEDSGLIHSLRGKAYSRDYHNVLNRYCKSINYHLRDYLKSVQRLLIGNWHMGRGRGTSLWGIHPQNRPVMMLHNSTVIGYKEKDGFEDDSDKLIVLPTFTQDYALQQVRDEWFPQERWDLEVDSLNESYFSTLDIQRSMVSDLGPPGEDGMVVWKDAITPTFYYPMSQMLNIDTHAWILSWQLEIRLIKSIGIGALYDKKIIGQDQAVIQSPPYTLSLAAWDMFTDQFVSWHPEGLRLQIQRKPSTDKDEPIFGPKTNSTLEPDHCFFLPIDTSILFDFVLEVRKLRHYRTVKSSNAEILPEDMVCPTVVEIENGIGEESMGQFFKGYSQDCVLRKLEVHSIVMLMSLVAWNEELCCIPLHTLDGFKEFLNSFH